MLISPLPDNTSIVDVSHALPISNNLLEPAFPLLGSKMRLRLINFCAQYHLSAFSVESNNPTAHCLIDNCLVH